MDLSISDLPVVSEDWNVQARYLEMRLAGQTHNMAELLATRSFPGVNGTDTAFNRGRMNGNQFEHCPQLGNYFRRLADQAGVSTTGKHYCYGLGRFPGDPRAWCSDTSDVLRIARDRKLNIDGIVNYDAGPAAPKEDIPLAPDILRRETAKVLAQNPSMRLEDAKEKAFNLRTGADLAVSEDFSGCDIESSYRDAVAMTEG